MYHCSAIEGILEWQLLLKGWEVYSIGKGNKRTFDNLCVNVPLIKGISMRIWLLLDLQPLPIPYTSFIDISMDFMERLLKSKGKDVIMVVIDRFSKYAHYIALSHLYSALTVAKLFIDNVYKLLGLPASIISDRDPMFYRRFWKKMFNIQRVNLFYLSAYHPRTRIVKKWIENYLRCMTKDCLKQWVRWLPLA